VAGEKTVKRMSKGKNRIAPFPGIVKKKMITRINIAKT
jgi:hypothetical protein